MAWTPYDRERPLEGFLQAVKLMEESGGHTIVEIGCMRMKLTHDPHQNCKECLSCCDGHSTAVFAKTGHPLYSIDVDLKAVELARETVKPYKNAHVMLKDGIQYLKSTAIIIDLLLLDAWDVGLPNCAEKHLEAYQVAKRRLSKKAVVAIDDCDVIVENGILKPSELPFNGKGELVIPYMIEDGWEIVRNGRVVILTR